MVTANLSPEDEQFLQDAVASGRYRTEQEALAAAVKLLRNSQQRSPVKSEPSREERLTKLREWMSRPRPGNPNLDDSRESIYEGCGE